MWMSRSSGEGGRTPNGRCDQRGQTEPLAALAAVFAVTVGLGIYAGGLHASLPPAGNERLAPTALDTAADRTSDTTGVLMPERLSRAPDAAPAGHRLNATLTADGRLWRVGPQIPEEVADGAARRVAVRLAPNRTTVGRLRVVIW
jgi:hypothetical protein